MGLRDIGHTLPPGFRFYPSDEELVCHYLYKKIANEEVLRGTLVEIDLHTCEPWQLPDVAKLNSNEWYFFSFRDRKYATGFRTNRATTSGYWKATGKDRPVFDPGSRAIVGMRKTLVFYKNRAPNGVKTGWIMHEFRLENPHVPPKEDWVLCRVFHKSRGENSTTFSPQDLYDSTAGATSPNLAASPTSEHALPSSYQNINSSFSNSNNVQSHHHQQNDEVQRVNPNTSLGLSPALDPTGYLHQLFHDHTIDRPQPSTYSNDHHKFVEAKCEDDDYGYLFDMSLDYPNGEAPSNDLDGMRFDNNDNGAVFI